MVAELGTTLGRAAGGSEGSGLLQHHVLSQQPWALVLESLSHAV